MSKKVVGEFVREDGKLVWRETVTYSLEDTGCIYLCSRPGDELHMVYKLTKVPGTDTYFWSGLWNSICVAGKMLPNHRCKSQNTFDSIEAAIQAMLDQGASVRRAYFSDLSEIAFRAK